MESGFEKEHRISHQFNKIISNEVRYGENFFPESVGVISY